MASVMKFVLLAALVAMFCLGVYDVLKNYENNACEMTYMFEVPEYMVRRFGLDIAKWGTIARGGDKW